MITMVGTVSLFVEDQDRAKAFYVDKMGFDCRIDVEMYPGAPVRWIDVAPAGAQTSLILYVPDENWSHYKDTVGKSQAITLTVDDLDSTYETLKSRGVTFVSEPQQESWGHFATIEDSEGNNIMLVQNSQ